MEQFKTSQYVWVYCVEPVEKTGETVNYFVYSLCGIVKTHKSYKACENALKRLGYVYNGNMRFEKVKPSVQEWYIMQKMKEVQY